MKNLFKKLLAIVLAVSMIGIPVINVGAAYTPINIIEDYTTYENMEQLDDGWSYLKDLTTSTVKLDNGLNIVQGDNPVYITSDRKQNSAKSAYLSKMFNYSVKDEENGTVSTYKKFGGKYELTFNYDSSYSFPSNYDGVKIDAPYYTIEVGTLKTDRTKIEDTILQLRFYTDHVRVVGAGSSIKMFYADSEITNHTVKLVLDTSEQTISAKLDENDAVEANFKEKTYFIEGFAFNDIERMNTGSYFNIKSVTFTELDSSVGQATAAVVESLPEKLADDITNVTENITLDEINGVTWVSSDENVISNTGVVTRGTENQTVTVTATVDLANKGNVVEKAYKMRVPKEGSEVVTPPSPPADVELVYFKEDYTKYNDFLKMPNWYNAGGEYATVSTVQGKGMEIMQTGTKSLSGKAQNTNRTPRVTHIMETVLKSDDTNRTSVRLHRFEGKYKMTMYFEKNVPSTYEKVEGVQISNAYYLVTIGKGDDINNVNAIGSKGLILRVNPVDMQVMNSTSSSSNSMSIKKIADGTDTLHTLEVIFDTDNGMMYVSYDGSEQSEGAFSHKFVNGFSIEAMERMKVDSYIRIHSVEMQQLEQNENLNKAMAALDALPEKLVDDPYNVTESFTIPTAENITWTSSESSVISEDGVVNRWHEDAEVVLTAAYEDGNTLIFKDYAMTVKADKNLVVTEILNEQISTEDDVKLWKFINTKDGLYGNYSVSEDGLTVKKAADKAESNEVVYTANNMLYFEEQPYDADSRSTLYSTGHAGVYDISFDVTPNVTGEEPVMIKLGRGTDKVIVPAITLKVYPQKIEAVNIDNGFDNTTVIYSGSTENSKLNIRLRVDTVKRLVWAYVNGEPKTKGLSFDGTEGEYLLDRLQVALADNNILGDSITVNNIVVNQLKKAVAEEKIAINSAVEKILISDVTANPDAMESIGNLPTEIDGFDVVWNSSSDFIDLENSKVYFKETSEPAIISATISGTMGSVVRKDFYVTIRAAKNTDELIEFIVRDLSSIITKQNINDIRYDINLPKEYMGMKIDWSSSDENIIDKDGKFSKNPNIKEPTVVTLTAAIDIGTKTVSTNINVTVSPKVGEYVICSGATAPSSFTVNGVENIRVSADTLTHIEFNQTNSNDGLITFVDSNGNEALKIKISDNSYVILSNDGESKAFSLPIGETASVDVMVMPDADRFAIWSNGELAVDYAMTLQGIDDISGINVTGTGLEVTNTKVTTDEYGMLNINYANVDYFAPLNKVLRENITLETNTILPATITWESSDKAVEISDDGKEGKVTTADTYKFVDVTLTISGENVSEQYTKQVAVGVDSSKNIAKNVNVKSTTLENEGSHISYINDGKPDTIFSTNTAQENFVAKLNFGKQVYVNTLYIDEDEKSINKYVLSYSDDGENWTEIKSGNITDLKSNLIEFDTIKTQYLKFEVTDSEGYNIYIRELEAYLFADGAEKAKLDVETVDLNLGYSVTEDITLPLTGVLGTELTWTSSNSDVISSTGKVTKPKAGTDVTLTVSATYGDKTFSKTFTIYVPSSSGNGGTVVGGGGSGSGGGGSAGASAPTASTVPGFVQTEDDTTTEEPATTDLFFDVPSTHWAHDSIKTLKEAGIVDGDGKGHFNPSDVVTREQFVKMIVEILGIETLNTNTKFEDVDSTMWYAPYIKAGMEAQLINGVSNTEFGVGHDIKRQDMAVMMYRILTKKNIQVTLDEVVFDDDAEISDYAKEAVYAVRAAGVIEGYNNEFNPTESLTRAEAATVLVKFLNLIQ